MNYNKLHLKALSAFFILLAASSCIKEEAQEQPMDGGQERFAEFDPVVRFGLDTYMGGADDTAPITKTTYAGDDKTIVLDKVRYERINWNGKSETDPNKPGYQDVIQIISQTNFTPKDNKTSVSYKVVEIPGTTNPNDKSREDYADAEPFSNDDKFYWSRPAGSKDSDKHYFYAVYPTSDKTVRPLTKVTRFDLDTSDSDPANHVAYIEGSINKRDDSDLEASRQQKYLDVISYTDGLLGKGQSCYEYLPDMKNAYLYAAAVMPGADAGYKKVPLRFKPLYSAVKLIVTAAEAGAKNYRLKRVDLRTDLHNNGAKEGRRDLNNDGVGTALGGSFSTYFKADATSGTTADFAKIDPASDPNTALADTLKRLFIAIDNPDDRRVLGDNVLKLTFLVLPIKQKVMTVDYTFEFLKGSELDPSDPAYLDPAVPANWTANPGKIVEVHRYLSLQRKTNQPDNKGLHNEFSDKDWYPLDPATKLYVRSNVPEIQYYFDVVTQGNLPRTWKAGSKKPGPKTGESFATKDFYEAKDFYSVISYRDSAGVLQPLRWKVTGYKKPTDTEYKMDNRPAWLNLRGDGPWKKVAPFDVDDPKHPGYPYTGTSSDFDPWDVPQGKGTTTFDLLTAVTKNGIVIGYEKFVRPFYNYTYYDAGAPDNDPRRPGWGWVNHGSYIHSTPDGVFVHHENDGVAFPDSTAWTGLKSKGEAYAYDLSSHDIYGNLTADFNGDINHATTANCYVVSAPGWYRFPAVYGNALKGGVDNYKAYNRDGTASLGIMGAFLDHTGTGIEDPWITYKYAITSVDIVWDDANRMLSKRYEPADTCILDRRPFCKKIGGKPYIYFYVDDIAQGNALIAAKSGNDIVWSWHIWAVTDPDKSLEEVKIQNNEKDVDGNINLYKSTYGNNNSFWKKMDLGQNGKETKVPARFCDVEFTQFFKGKEVQKVVRRVYQSGVEDTNEIVPAYQWGRKDPMPIFKGKLPIQEINTKWYEGAPENTKNTILHPDIFYCGANNQYVAQGLRYDNLWNTNVDSYITRNTSDNSAGGSLDREVEKTIYDPSPPGFSLPNMYAYSGLNPYSPIQQIKIPNATTGPLNGVAKNNPVTTFSSSGYVEFYCEYKESATYRRNTSGSTITFYARGRVNGNANASSAGARQWYFPLTENDVGAFYWTSEPAAWSNSKALHGRSFYFRGPGVRPDLGWYMYPVAGMDIDGQDKWQRTHGLTIRPMREHPPVSP